MQSVVTTASDQLFSRPADECYASWEDLLNSLHRRESHTKEHNANALSVTPLGDKELMLNAHVDGVPGQAHMTDWSFRLLCSKAKAPYYFLNQLPADNVANDLNLMLERHDNNGKKTVINIHQGEDDTIPTARAFYTPTYSRISDYQFAHQIHEHARDYGYEPAGVFAGRKWGEESIRPEATGLYSGDRDVFLFLANEQDPIPHDNGELYHAVIAWNSEVCARKFHVEHMLYDAICMNHIIWGVCEHRMTEQRHVGDVRRKFIKSLNLFPEMDARRKEDNELIYKSVQMAQRKRFADTREKAQEKLAGYMNKKQASNALAYLDDDRAFKKNPLSVWGVTSAMTLYSQTLSGNADVRHSIDATAGKILNGLSIS